MTAVRDLAAIAGIAVTAGASQSAPELAAALEQVVQVDPLAIIEIGCDRGGTLFAWRTACPAARVLGVTTADNSYASGGSGMALVDHGADVLFADSHDPSALAWVREWLRGAPADVLVLDGDHHAAGVRADLAMYGPLVRPGGLILLHDICPTADPRAEVHTVWPDLAARYETGEIRQAYGWGIIRVRPGDEFTATEGTPACPTRSLP